MDSGSVTRMTADDARGTPVRVICVVYNPGDELLVFEESLRAATTMPYELVIVDNGEPSEAVAMLEASGAAWVLRTGANLGYGTAANAGARGSDGPWLVVANPDLVWEPGALDVLLEAGAGLADAGALGPRVLNEDGTAYPSGRQIPSLLDGAGHAVLGKVWAGNPFSARYRSEAEALVATQPTEVGWLSGACLVLRRSAFEAVGGFDESYFMFVEDLDLGDRLAKAGWRNVLVPAARVVHAQGLSWKRRPEAMIRAHHRSMRHYLSGRYGAWYQAPVRWALCAGLWVREQLAVARG